MKQANDHGKTKYNRTVFSSVGGEPATADVYSVLEAFDVRCPARQHALKKLLCAGIRGKGGVLSDLNEAKVSIERAIQLQVNREALDGKGGGTDV